jgi:hypothetical protein
MDRLAQPVVTSATAAPQSLPQADINAVLIHLRSIGRNRASCDLAVAASFRSLHEKQAALDDLRPIFKFAVAWDPQQYKDGERSVEQFRADMSLLRCEANIS